MQLRAGPSGDSFQGVPGGVKAGPSLVRFWDEDKKVLTQTPMAAGEICCALTCGVGEEILTAPLLPDEVRLVDSLEVLAQGGVLDRDPKLFAVAVDVFHERIHVAELDR